MRRRPNPRHPLTDPPTMTASVEREALPQKCAESPLGGLSLIFRFAVGYCYACFAQNVRGTFGLTWTPLFLPLAVTPCRGPRFSPHFYPQSPKRPCQCRLALTRWKATCSRCVPPSIPNTRHSESFKERFIEGSRWATRWRWFRHHLRQKDRNWCRSIGTRRGARRVCTNGRPN